MPGPKSDKVWADAVHKAVHEYHEAEDESGKAKKVRYINQLAANLVQDAMNGNMEAMKEIGNRLDGRPHQSSSVEVEPSDALTELLKVIDGNRVKARHDRSVEQSDMAPPQSVLHH